MADLKGKTIGITGIGGMGEFTVVESLRRHGLVKDRDFSVIDRETYWVAARASDEGIPFLGLRVVIDGIDQELPPESCYDSDTGEVMPGKFTSWLVKHPFKVGDLPRLGWNSVRARRRLGEAINRVVPALLEC